MSALVERLGMDVPVFQAPLAGGGDTPELHDGIALLHLSLSVRGIPTREALS